MPGCLLLLCDLHGTKARIAKIFATMMFALRLQFSFSTIPNATTQRDYTSGHEERWITVGAIAPGLIPLVVHAF